VPPRAGREGRERGGRNRGEKAGKEGLRIGGGGGGHALPPQHACTIACSCWRELRRAREIKEERGWAEKLDGEVEARLYICFSRFGREAKKAWEKHINSRRNSKIGLCRCLLVLERAKESEREREQRGERMGVRS
jgi:hypothetical protein